jgi:hypothetical protein
MSTITKTILIMDDVAELKELAATQNKGESSIQETEEENAR